MASTLMIPGFGGSGELHWQTIWQRADPTIVRFRPVSWDAPDLGDWLAALDSAIAAVPEPILVAHSLGCLLVAHWAAQRAAKGKVQGAMLVAVPDPAGPNFPIEAASFREVPEQPLPFPTLVVASTNDPFGSIDYVRRQALAWRAGVVTAGALGHINSLSGHGDWPLGAMLLEAFRSGLGE